jgi:hypothetical protein
MVNLSWQYLREFSKTFESVLMGYSGAGGKLIHEKNQKSKISRHCPFNVASAWLVPIPVAHFLFQLLHITAMAINDSTEKKLKLCQIYDWIKSKFPYYRVSPTV